ncbi:hypothetical protein ELG72_37635 [Rhizobium leguminosarum]|uniref:hypothetical protein n=1 Tax=Rhizobium TaxID=379 RepID=UPI00102FE9BC|nr:hypothetical protein [Rhizobium leguminosarum]TBF87888.1 hypothetical protein ELG82_37465 [Rhizobium leguminosarum]TBG07131.1 hypothetical protein ELG80_37230 [Rhizobium leguminosarum]TBG07695.1 hypothetical protein ELG81_37535 [Rhizobium leguminosarum]TBG30815.1 hypothetical protein ELG75_36930 [Rhizobium leguminosarum]TBG50061.1 hypothetical protein ELG72_37635 [Rhizobium leguminosarum]
MRVDEWLAMTAVFSRLPLMPVARKLWLPILGAILAAEARRRCPSMAVAGLRKDDDRFFSARSHSPMIQAADDRAEGHVDF